MRSLFVLVAALLTMLTLALTACSSEPEPVASPAATTTTTTTTTAKVADPVTANACQTFHDDPAVAEVKQSIGGGAATIDTFAVADAFAAVHRLELVAVQPGLDSEVAAAMTEASKMSAAMRKAWVEDATIDPTAFLRMIDYVDSACEDAGVDLA